MKMKFERLSLFSPLTPALFPLRGEGARPPASANSWSAAASASRDGTQCGARSHPRVFDAHRASAATPSPINGERAGVRGETVRFVSLQSTPLRLVAQSPVPNFQFQIFNLPRRAALVVLIVFSILISTSPVRADLPAPDNILYGTIVLGSQPVTAVQTNVIVETRRTLTGPALSSYRMGSEPEAGNFYVLKITLEELAPTTGAASSLPGQSVFVVVRDASGPKATNTFLIAERGVVTRLDLGISGNGDTDGDGLPDAWELARFGDLSRNGTALGANGQTLLQNYVAGTDPANPNDRFALNIAPGVPSRLVSFLARQASGPGYENRSRIYALEYATNLNSGPWVGVPGRTNILGNNSVISYPTAEPGAQVFYRGQVRLQAP